MERQKYIFISLSVLLTMNSWASNKEKIYEAYISGNMKEWKTVIDQMQRQSEKPPEFLIELVNYQYGYIGWCIGEDKNGEAKQTIKLAEENLEKLKNRNYSISEINAYKSALYGFKIGLSPIKATILGPKSLNHSKLAIEQDKTNPMGCIQYGNSQFYMPPVFGGSKKEAVEYFLKALRLMETEKAKTEDNWNYLSLLTQIAQSYEDIDETEKADSIYNKILETEPRFEYVKKELYPDFLKKKNKNE
ncbi:hypothetical protein [Maribellus maritimus]|uniref:hypothetical protein n=1 Tax=Maribellus maritimus TaxID=2870838 RepID=UPI001EEB47C8|nr:hypothetical protein [Maribellus maritimus]MCG6189190.1 hypothetical protein [Maribellus maritimus]